jgi:hypothetical protein
MDSRAGAVEERESLTLGGAEGRLFWPYETSLWLESNCETRCKQSINRKKKKAT